MPVLIDIEKDYLYNLGLQKQAQLLSEMKADFKAKIKKANLEKAAAKAKAEAKKLAELRLQHKQAIIKMKAAKLEDATIMDFLNLEELVFRDLLKEIDEEA